MYPKKLLLDIGKKIKLKKQEVKNLIKESTSFSDFFKKLKISKKHFNSVRDYILKNNIDISHFKQNKQLDSYFRKHKKQIDNKTLKNILIKKELVYNECNICKLKPIWNNKQLKFQLDHINGDNKDNRLINLRLLCPNCHSQTPTHSINKKYLPTCSRF